MRQRSFKKHFTFNNFNEILYCGMTRLKNTNFSVFKHCQYTRTIVRNKYMGQSLFKKHSKFQNFDETLYCGMTRFRNVKLGVFRQYQNTKTIQKRKIWDRMVLRMFQNSKNFNFCNFTLTWSSKGKMNSVRLDLTYSKELQQKMKMLKKPIFKNIRIAIFQ